MAAFFGGKVLEIALKPPLPDPFQDSPVFRPMRDVIYHTSRHVKRAKIGGRGEIFVKISFMSLLVYLYRYERKIFETFISVGITANFLLGFGGLYF